jgi:hypothetical protein
MNGSFIKPDEINDFVESNKNNNDSSIFKYNDGDPVGGRNSSKKENSEVKEVPFR